MIPYVPQPVWTVGPLTIHAFGLCAAAALLTGYLLVDRRAHRYGLLPTPAARAYLVSVAAGLLGGFAWSRMEGGHGISLSGLAAGGILGLLLSLLAFARATTRRTSLRRTLDLYAFPLPFVLVIARLGCFFAHDHIGNPTDSWLGVRFPGGTRFDLGLLYAMAAAATGALLLWLDRRRPRDGTVFLLAALLLGSARLAILSFGAEPRADYVAAIVVPLLCAALWFWAKPLDRPVHHGPVPE